MASATVSSPRSRAKWFNVPPGMATSGQSARATSGTAALIEPSPPTIPSARAPTAARLVRANRLVTVRRARRFAAAGNGGRFVGRSSERGPTGPTVDDDREPGAVGRRFPGARELGAGTGRAGAGEESARGHTFSVATATPAPIAPPSSTSPGWVHTVVDAGWATAPAKRSERNGRGRHLDRGGGRERAADAACPDGIDDDVGRGRVLRREGVSGTARRGGAAV